MKKDKTMVPAWRLWLIMAITAVVFHFEGFYMGKKDEETSSLKAQILERNQDEEALKEINENLPNIIDSNFWGQL